MSEEGIDAYIKINNAAIVIKQLQGQLMERDAKIDALMFEYCPDEMTDEQIERYEASMWPDILKQQVDGDMKTEEILGEVLSERGRQNMKWGGPFYDDQHAAFDWHEMIADYNGWARRMAAMGSNDKARRRYIQIAALAVAAVEAIDRKAND